MRATTSVDPLVVVLSPLRSIGVQLPSNHAVQHEDLGGFKTAWPNRVLQAPTMLWCLSAALPRAFPDDVAIPPSGARKVGIRWFRPRTLGGVRTQP